MLDATEKNYKDVEVFIMHIGSKGSIDIDYTIMRYREFDEILDKIPNDAPELEFFKSHELRKEFPNGKFNCWGIPSKAEKRFQETQVGDLVLFIPHIGTHEGGIHQLGIVKAKCPIRSLEASKALWPDTPDDKLYPFIFFFNTEVGFRDWFGFLEDLGIQSNWNPNGYYRKIASFRFDKFGGADKYLELLRNKYGFTRQGVHYLARDEGESEYFEESFQPNFVDSREYSFRAIKARRGQQNFRSKLRNRYGDECMISGCKIVEILEAAHIKPFRNIEDNDEQNGLLLRADIHTLFDLDLIGINPINTEIEIHSLLYDSEYEKLKGKKLRIKSNKKPSQLALKYRWKLFEEKRKKL